VNETKIDLWLPKDIKNIEYNTKLLKREAQLYNRLAWIIEQINKAAGLLG
jgi:hypothetical protein